uniref:GOLD domain-containing protein n=1 Tax=Setaria digitata TaxID=48799 RepID=A0A915Q5Q6_9BILA
MYLKTILWLATSLMLCSGFTQYIMSGGQTYGFIVELFFDVSSATELNCFYEEFLRYSDLSISARSVDAELQTISMRIRSPSKNISNWYKGIDQAVFNQMIREGGVYEICIKSNLKGVESVRLMLVIYAHHRATMNEANRMQKEHSESTKNMNESINHLRESIASSAIALKRLKSTRDLQLQIKNARDIDTFSMMQTIVILCTAIVQVIVIRKFFASNYKNANIVR